MYLRYTIFNIQAIGLFIFYENEGFELKFQGRVLLQKGVLGWGLVVVFQENNTIMIELGYA